MKEISLGLEVDLLLEEDVMLEYSLLQNDAAAVVEGGCSPL